MTSFLSGVVDAGANVVADAKQLSSAAGGILLKGENGAKSRAADPEAIRHQLGTGQALNSEVQSRMEPAFGQSLSGLRVHNDATAVRLSETLNARAFTVGEHIAFGAGGC